MNAFATSQCARRLGFALAVLAGVAAVSPAQAQTQAPGHSLRPVPQTAPPAAIAPAVAAPATPVSPLPNPTGLTSQFPAGLPSPMPNPAGLPSPTVPNLASPGTPAGSRPIDAEVAPQTSVMGASGYGGGSAVRPSPGVGGGTYTALDIARSFIGADANRDGELTRAEAQRLTIMPYSFEEMDRNHDGILTRFEYEDGVR
ncbi:MAG TPA: hypothetical protein VNN06_07745 [Ramlibacter sp.]|nr:hypothetical protein [Ramlibacter sp.]